MSFHCEQFPTRFIEKNMCFCVRYFRKRHPLHPPNKGFHIFIFPFSVVLFTENEKKTKLRMKILSDSSFFFNERDFRKPIKSELHWWDVYWGRLLKFISNVSLLWKDSLTGFHWREGFLMRSNFVQEIFITVKSFDMVWFFINGWSPSFTSCMFGTKLRFELAQ